MFHRARLKLTVWYLLIIMIISILFSVAIYKILTNELERGFQRLSHRYIVEQQDTSQLSKPQLLEPEYLETAKERIQWTLFYINLAILSVSGLAGYFLAGRTLKPIKIMVDEQNRFIADASHELRTPLTSLRSEIEVYLRGKSHSISKANTLLRSNLEEVNALQVLTDNLLQLVVREEVNGQSPFENVSLSEILEQAQKKIQSLAKHKDIIIVNKTHDEIVWGDRQTLIQLFIILLENSVKYSSGKTKVVISSQKKDSSIAIDISDQGIGIDKKDIPHVFDRFFRTDSSRSKENVAGYGLGLSIAKKIIEAHSGLISVKSDVGKGTVFIVQLPKSS